MKKTLILLSAIALLFNSCSKELDLQPDAKKASVNKLQNAIITNGITKFVFTKADNPGLNEDEEGVITEDNQINVTIYADGISLTNLKPTITYNGEAMVSPLSGVAKNFTRGVFYTYYNTEFGTSITYTVKVTVKPAAARPTLYFSGHFGLSNDKEAFYWKNGNLVKIVSSTAHLITRGIAVENNNVYVAGNIYLGVEPNYTMKAVYWKNGIEFILSNNFSSVEDITASGNDIYILGRNGLNPVYWKNGIETILDANPNIIHRKIIVIGSDIYTIGSQKVNNEYADFYSKNGVKTFLPIVDTYRASAYSISISNDDVYVFGFLSNYRESKQVCWKNGVLMELPNINVDSKVYKGDIYTTSTYSIFGGTKAAYWKNGARKELETSTYMYTIAENLFFHGDDIYIFGKDLGAYYTRFMYWTNGKLNIFTTDKDATITGMFVK